MRRGAGAQQRILPCRLASPARQVIFKGHSAGDRHLQYLALRFLGSLATTVDLPSRAPTEIDASAHPIMLVAPAIGRRQPTGKVEGDRGHRNRLRLETLPSAKEARGNADALWQRRVR